MKDLSGSDWLQLLIFSIIVAFLIQIIKNIL